MADIEITADLPAGQSRDERVAALAEVVDAGLKTAAADPEMRLQMILGEAHRRYRDLCLWLADQLIIDEAKAPGLRERASKTFRERPDMLMRRHRLKTPAEAADRQRMLGEALARLIERGRQDLRIAPPIVAGHPGPGV